MSQQIGNQIDTGLWWAVRLLDSAGLLNITFQRFDHSGKGELTEKELYNVLKMQNQVDCTREEVFLGG